MVIIRRVLLGIFFIVLSASLFAGQCVQYECAHEGSGVDGQYNEKVDAGFEALRSKEWDVARDLFVKASNVSRTGEMPNIFVWHLIALSSYKSEKDWEGYLEKATFSAKLLNGIIRCGPEGFLKNTTGRQEFAVDPPSERLSHERLCVGAYSDVYADWNLDYVVHKSEFARRVTMVRDCIQNDESCNELWSD